MSIYYAEEGKKKSCIPREGNFKRRESLTLTQCQSLKFKTMARKYSDTYKQQWHV